jgi:predicted nucleotide-binding protein
MAKWNSETAIAELERYLNEMRSLRGGDHTNPDHTRWLIGLMKFLPEVFPNDSTYFHNMKRVRWQYYGTMAVHVNEMFQPGSTEARYNGPAYDRALNTAEGILLAAHDELAKSGLDDSAPAELETKDIATPARKVFVVHGHDTEMKETVARFLERIEFEAIILHEQANGGDTIIEKFERNADVGYAVVLLSGDDVGAAVGSQDELKSRARQNVVLELGYFIGRLGRSHVCPLVKGDVEIPSDFHGVVYVPFDGESWKLHLVRELRHLGFDLDTNKVF